MPPTTTPTIAIIGASGKLGGATLRALLEHRLQPASHIVALTSSQPGSETWETLAATSSSTYSSSSSSSSPAVGSSEEDRIQVRHATFDSPQTLTAALQGVDVFFLVSTPRISMDFNEAGPGQGREKHHVAAIDAAVAAGVQVLVYSSLAFGWHPSFASPSSSSSSSAAAGGNDEKSRGTSKAGVMRAHLRTESYLAQLRDSGKLQSTVIREGLYNESWPLYMGYFDIPGYMSASPSSSSSSPSSASPTRENKTVVKLAGDGKISWTSIKDLGIGNALVLASLASSSGREAEFSGKTFYLSTPASEALSLSELADVITAAAAAAAAEKSQGAVEQSPPKIEVQIVPRDEHVNIYTARQGAESRPGVEWWVSTYAALGDGECLVDDPTLGRLLRKVGVKPTPMTATVKQMLLQKTT
ncbi:hypothetical protein Micbo1qcDRAFT_168217 [Microdochium bolleyi]|uniref:NmrA-like domain-containing protein n=1 Tax=Microdochium bolleyi TaxID=196109 RepID=A0A136IP84_9PEZI|nr:hypothetical protein Micbo1qcDRAFT_168217 [Microdochium bolleyi]